MRNLLRLGRITGIIMLALALALGGCIFGRSRGPRVLGARDGVIHLTGDRTLHIATLDDSWRVFQKHPHSVVWRHAPTGAMLTVSTWCGRDFEDLPLKQLMQQLWQGVEPLSESPAVEKMVDGREALQQASLRVVDGVRVSCDALVVKKNNCAFDIVLNALPHLATQVHPAFVQMINQLHWE